MDAQDLSITTKRRRMSEEIIAKDENFILTYHQKSKKVSCVCGELITRDHTCSIIKSGHTTRLIFQTCGYENGHECQDCSKEENLQKYMDSSYKDRDGYEYCSFCDNHVHCCSCPAFVDIDGIEKCIKCKELWDSPDVESGKCKSCGFDGY